MVVGTGESGVNTQGPEQKPHWRDWERLLAKRGNKRKFWERASRRQGSAVLQTQGLGNNTGLDPLVS